MSEHRASVHWSFSGADFRRGRYSREHTWRFDGGVTVPASPSPSVVPAPFSNPAGVDPEEAFVAAVASCHMLTFLHLASKRGFLVERYADDAVGVMTKNERGKYWVSRVSLNPEIVYGAGAAPTSEQIAELHHLAHEECFIANSIRTEVVVAERG
ncbi:MAG: OsmC family protein [Gammaproteobacteria bacterium]|nr:OsmC family protein [Gammaproteobacteria bacterium]MBI5615421.1 OsmC family protein [Gammaproteobacteria bacterium]